MDVVLPLLVGLGGCSSYTAAQLHLAGQARKGVAVWIARESGRDDEIRQAFAARRSALGAAFDADARARDRLDADWVIESRRAYAAGLDLLAQSEASALANNDAARRDAAATDDALARLAWLLSIQSDAQSIFTSMFNPGGGKP